MNDLMSYLLNYALKHDIGCILEQLPPSFEARALPEKKLIIINTSWHNTNEVPFITGHEIGHIMNNDNIYECQPTTASYPLELSADKYSLDLIFRYATRLDFMIHEPEIFIQKFGIPQRMLIYTQQLYNNNKDLIF